MGYIEHWHDAIYCKKTVKVWYWEWVEICEPLYYCHVVNRSKGLDKCSYSIDPITGGGYMEIIHPGVITGWYSIEKWAYRYYEFAMKYLHTLCWYNGSLVFDEYVYLYGGLPTDKLVAQYSPESSSESGGSQAGTLATKWYPVFGGEK